MLDRERLAGPTLAEFAASALTPQIAEALRETMTVRDDGSVKIDFSAPPAAVAEMATFLARLGVNVRYVPARLSADELEYELRHVLDAVAHDEVPVNIDLDGRTVHLSPGPAPAESVDLHALAVKARRASRRLSARGGAP